MGLKTLVTALEKDHISEVNIAMGEEQIGTLTAVRFEVSFADTVLGSNISIPKNEPYAFKGREEIPYRRIWNELCTITPPNPFVYVGKNIHDYTVNIPNALHLLTGWLSKARKFQELLEQRKLAISIKEIAGKSYDPLVLEQLFEASEGCYPGLYKGYLVEMDASIN